MKFTIEVDCTPEEARRFLGLPDVESLQKKVMAEVERRTLAEMDRFSPEAMLKGWLNVAPSGAGTVQEAFSKLFQPTFGMESATKRGTKK